MSSTRMLVLGGYLGAGKTTLAVNLARTLKTDRDKSVAIITNDQGDVLVDTEYSKDAGFDTREIMGGCFCKNFDEFVSSARTLVTSGKPDIIIAEPIGSSTNLMSSVVSPMRTMYPDEFSVAPFCVVVDCVRALGFLSKDKERTVDTVDLIPEHQIRDAEIIILTKTDLVGRDTIDAVRAKIDSILPGCRMIETSSKDLRNISEIVDMILSDEMSMKAPLAEDNRGFAFEKAKLGWYSGTYDIKPTDDLDMYSISTDMMKAVATEYGADSIVHVKVMLESEDAACKMSLVQKEMQVDGIEGSRFMKSPGRLVLNARVISPPKKLEEVMRNIVDTVSGNYPVELIRTGEKCFMPKPESPSHFFFE